MERYFPDHEPALLGRIRERVRAGIGAIEAGEFTEYEGRKGLKKLASRIKQRGRMFLDRQRLIEFRDPES